MKEWEGEQEIPEVDEARIRRAKARPRGREPRCL